ncbi:MAG: VWA domain-containing protein, partial [Candidatus Latescibacteria bacterium]|nr:VWA domain-containing protein [Candidatus Latescibacterota bacterium]
MIEFEVDIPWQWMMVLVAVVLMISLSRRRQLSTRRLIISTILRLATVILVCLALANPIQRTVNPGSQNILFLIDRSDSIDPLGRDHSLSVMRDVQRLQQKEDLAGLMSFATETVVEAPLIRGFEAFAPKSSVATDATDIASAVEQGLASLPRNGENTIVLMSDGNETVRSTRSVVESARKRGVVIHTVPLARTGQENWSADKISAPRKVNAGERFNIRALLMNDGDIPLQARVILRRNGQPINDEKSVSLSNGTTPISMVYKITEPG